MKTVLRAIVGILVGVLVAFILVVAVELFSSVVHPLPEGFGGTMEEMCRHVENYPDWVLSVAILMWGATAFLGTWTARKIGSVFAGAFVGLVLLVALLFNISMLPYPTWFEIVIVITILVATVLGSGVLRRRSTTTLIAVG